jgi:hypothetical protein
VVIGVLPGFCAEMTLDTKVGRYRSRASRGQRQTTPAIAPAAVLIWTGHCGCLADQWWDLPCVCVDTEAPTPPGIVPVPDWEYLPH